MKRQLTAAAFAVLAGVGVLGPQAIGQESAHAATRAEVGQASFPDSKRPQVGVRESSEGAVDTTTSAQDPAASAEPSTVGRDERSAQDMDGRSEPGDAEPAEPATGDVDVTSPAGARCRDGAAGGRGAMVPACPREELRTREAGRPLLDLWGPVRRAIDGWFRDLAEAALEPVLDLLGRTVFTTPDVTVPGAVRDYWSYSLAIADAVLLLIVIAAGLVLMGHESVQTRTTIKEVAPRLVLAVVAANTSLAFAGMLIRAANTLSSGFVGDFEPKSGHGVTELMILVVVGVLAGGNVFLALLAIGVAGLGIAILCTYVARVATVIVLVGAAPLFLIAHALPQLEGAARLWWRSLLGCLGVQIGQSLVLAAAIRVFFHDDGKSLAGMPGGGVMDLLIVGSLFWLMLRIPSYASRMIFAPRSSSLVTQQVAHRAVSRGMGALTGAVR